MQTTTHNQQLIQSLNSTLELVAYVTRNHPNLPYPEKKIQIWEKCCEIAQHKFDPESIFRMCRRLRDDERSEYSLQRETIYHYYFKS